MATWPVDNKVVAIKERRIKPSNRQISSSGYTLAFSQGTITKRAWILSLDYLTSTDKGNIETFFDANQGLAITLNNPDPNGSGSFTVLFDQDELEFVYKRTFPGEYTLELNVREV